LVKRRARHQDRGGRTCHLAEFWRTGLAKQITSDRTGQWGDQNEQGTLLALGGDLRGEEWS